MKLNLISYTGGMVIRNSGKPPLFLIETIKKFSEKWVKIEKIPI